MGAKFWRASVETRNFHFEAYGETRDEALQVLRLGWLAHSAVMQATLAWSDLAEDVQVREVEVGVAYRDGEGI